MDNKNFTTQLSQELGCELKDAVNLMSHFISILRDRATNLDSISLPGFGNFVAVKTPEEVSVDPATHRRVLLPPQIKIEFVASSTLKNKINS